jgi:hypothetical protein
MPATTGAARAGRSRLYWPALASWFGPQALTVVLPVRDGHSVLLEERLEAERVAVRAKLSGVTSLHFGRFVFVPRLDAARSRDLLLFESNFDGGIEEHVAELVDELGAELAALFSHCEDPGARSVAALLRYGSRRTGAWFCAHPALSAGRVQVDARIRAAFRHFLRSERERLRERSELGIVEEAQALLLRDFGPAVFDEPDEILPDAAGASLGRVLGLGPLLARSAVQDIVDLVSDLWTDAKLDRSGVEARLQRVVARDAGGAQRALTHVVELKPGRFRRRALNAALRFVDGWLRSAPGRRSFGSSHFARWVELGDGRLAFLSHHDQSFEAELGSLVEQLGFVTSLVWSHTRDFPPGLGALIGGTRDEARFKDWVLAKCIPTAIAYSAYPELSVSEVARAAELREILGGKLEERTARRALELV